MLIHLPVCLIIIIVEGALHCMGFYFHFILIESLPPQLRQQVVDVSGSSDKVSFAFERALIRIYFR